VAELRQLRSRELRQHVLRLRVEMSVPAPEYEEAEEILRDLEGTPASHPRVGLLELDRQALKLDTSDLEVLCADLPEVLKAAMRKLQDKEKADPSMALVAQRALYHLYQTAKKAL
jgi:hypothetical protein